jgi:hypothetical protein
MPEYVYGCDNKHKINMVHPMFDMPTVLCPECGAVMHRIPQWLRINFAWLRQPDPSPVVKHYLDTADERRDKYLETHPHARS